MNSSINKAVIYDVFFKLLGDVAFYGNESYDPKSLKNMQIFRQLLIDMVDKVCGLYFDSKDRIESSTIKLNKEYKDCLLDLLSTILSSLDEKTIAENIEGVKIKYTYE